MGNKKECSCAFWNKEQEECLYAGQGCIRDEVKPEVTEEWIEEKAREMAHTDFLGATDVYIGKAIGFIRSLIKEIK